MNKTDWEKRKEAGHKMKTIRARNDELNQRKSSLSWAWKIQWKLNSVWKPVWRSLSIDNYTNLKWTIAILVGSTLTIIGLCKGLK